MTPNSALVSWTAATGSQPMFYITNYRVDGNTDWIPNQLGLTQTTSQQITGLAGATTYNVRVQASNHLGVAFSNVVNFTTPAGVTVLRDFPIPTAWQGGTGVISDRVVPIEFFAASAPGTIVTRNFTVNAEWTGPTGVFRDMVVQIDIGATPLAPPLQVQNLRLSGPTDTTLIATWDSNFTGPRADGYQVQWSTGGGAWTNVVPTVPEVNNPVSVSRSFTVPLEFGGHVTFSRSVDIPLEWRGGKSASRDFTVPAEWRGNTIVTRSFDVPVEFRGTTTNVTRDVIVPLERRTTQRRDTGFGIEWSLTTTPTPSPTYTEIDLGDPTTLTDGSGLVWGLIQNNGGVATINGVQNGESSYCDILVWRISTNVIWIRDQQNSANWYFFTRTPTTPPGFWTGPTTVDPRL